MGWSSDGRLIMAMVAVQQQHVQAVMEDRLGERYLRVDAQWPVGAGLGIDVATPAATGALVALGLDSVADLDAQRIRQFL